MDDVRLSDSVTSDLEISAGTGTGDPAHNTESDVRNVQATKFRLLQLRKNHMNMRVCSWLTITSPRHDRQCLLMIGILDSSRKGNRRDQSSYVHPLIHYLGLLLVHIYARYLWMNAYLRRNRRLRIASCAIVVSFKGSTGGRTPSGQFIYFLTTKHYSWHFADIPYSCYRSCPKQQWHCCLDRVSCSCLS